MTYLLVGLWPGPEVLKLGLDRLFPLLGILPIIPQQTFRSTLPKETRKDSYSGNTAHRSQLGSRHLTNTRSQVEGPPLSSQADCQQAVGGLLCISLSQAVALLHSEEYHWSLPTLCKSFGAVCVCVSLPWWVSLNFPFSLGLSEPHPLSGSFLEIFSLCYC